MVEWIRGVGWRRLHRDTLVIAPLRGVLDISDKAGVLLVQGNRTTPVMFGILRTEYKEMTVDKAPTLIRDQCPLPSAECRADDHKSVPH